MQAAHGFGLVGSWNALQSSGGGLQGFTPQPRRAHDKFPACAEGCMHACIIAPMIAKGCTYIGSVGPCCICYSSRWHPQTQVVFGSGAVQRLDARWIQKQLCDVCSMRRGRVWNQGVDKQLQPK